MTAKLKRLLLMVAIVVPLDQVSKAWVAAHVSPYQPIELIGGFLSITHARNPGIALGMFQDLPMFIFIGLTLGALWLVISFFRQIRDDDLVQATALGMILGGALGNLIDRSLRGAVIDFIQFDLQLFIFPDFNVADSAIVLGVALMLLTVAASHEEEPAGPEEEPEGSAAKDPPLSGP
jgi:signal peptidase II